MRANHLAKIGEMCEMAFAVKKGTAKLPLSCWIARESEGCETLHFSAAREKFNSCATARK